MWFLGTGSSAASNPIVNKKEPAILRVAGLSAGTTTSDVRALFSRYYNTIKDVMAIKIQRPERSGSPLQTFKSNQEVPKEADLEQKLQSMKLSSAEPDVSEAECSAFDTRLKNALALAADASNAKRCAKALAEMGLLAKARGSGKAWDKHLPQAMVLIFDNVRGPRKDNREAAVHVLQAIAAHQAPAFGPHTEMSIPIVLGAFDDENQLVQIAADGALKAVVDHALEPVLILEALAAFLPDDEGAEGPDHGPAHKHGLDLSTFHMHGSSVVAAVRMLGRVVSQNTMPPQELMRHTAKVLPGLFQAFKSPNADVRKAVVDTLVEMYLVLGEWLMPHLSPLSTAQLKLVTIYINRLTSAGKENSRPRALRA